MRRSSTTGSSARRRRSRRRRKSGAFDYDARARGRAGDRPLHAAAQAHLSRLRPARRSQFVGDRRRSRARWSRPTATRAAGSWSIRSGTGPYRLEEWRRGQKIVLEASPTFRDEYVPGERAAGGSRDRGEDARQEAADDRPRRDQHHRGIESAAAGVRKRRARLHRRPDRPRAEGAERRQAEARVRRARHRPRPRRPADRRLHVLQHGGPDRRRVHQRQDRAAARDQHGLQQRGRDQGDPPRSGDARDAADSAQRRRPRSRLTRAARTTTSPAPRRCSTSSATSTATATAGATCPTASR